MVQGFRVSGSGLEVRVQRTRFGVLGFRFEGSVVLEWESWALSVGCAEVSQKCGCRCRGG